MTYYAVLRTPSGPVRFRVNTEARDDEPVLVREEEMTENTKPQPTPQNADATAVWPLVMTDVALLHEHRTGLRDAVLADMNSRHAEGVKKYGVPLVAHNGRDHAADAYQEALDGAVYWRAEHEKTGSKYAQTLYWDSMRHAWNCRMYLLERDGR